MLNLFLDLLYNADRNSHTKLVTM